MSIELKPCPFCGGAAKVHEMQSKTSRVGGYFVMCNKCLTSSNNYSTTENAIEHWNRRTSDAEGETD